MDKQNAEMLNSELNNSIVTPTNIGYKGKKA